MLNQLFGASPTPTLSNKLTIYLVSQNQMLRRIFLTQINHSVSNPTLALRSHQDVKHACDDIYLYFFCKYTHTRNDLSFAESCGEPLAQLDQQSVLEVAYLHPSYLFTQLCLISSVCLQHEHAIGRSDSELRYVAPKDGRNVLCMRAGSSLRGCDHATRLPCLSPLITERTAWAHLQNEDLSLTTNQSLDDPWNYLHMIPKPKRRSSYRPHHDAIPYRDRSRSSVCRFSSSNPGLR